MAYLNTKRSALFFKSGGALPVPPANFFEVSEEFVINPSPTIEEFNRVSGKLGTTDSFADSCHTVFNQSISHKMRSSNVAADAMDTPPEYGEMLKLCGFDETIVTTLGAESVTYTNSQAPTPGSGIAYVDGKKFTMTGGVVGDATFTFEIGKVGVLDVALSGFLDNGGVPVDQANPSVTLNDEPTLIVSCADIITAGGTSISADKITISMGATIEEYYALGLKEYDISDYVIKLTADFYVDGTNYADAITKLNAETAEAIVIKLGTNQTGALINGKSIEIKADVAKANAFTDSTDKSRVKRSMTWLLRPNGTDVNLSIKHGFFA